MSTAVVRLDKPAGIIDRLAALTSQKSRREFIARHRTKLNLGIIIEMADRARQLLRVDARQSLALSEIAIVAARLLRDRLAMAHAVRIKANAKYALDEHRAALKLYNQAIRSFEAGGDRTELGRTLSVSILSLTLCGQYDAAFAAAARAREIFTEQNDELRLARLEINLGNVYFRQDRFSEALNCYKNAYRVVLAYRDAEALGVVLSNLAVCLISMGEFAEAFQTYEEARELCRQHGMPRLVAQADYNIAYLYYLRGEYSRAIEMLRSTRVICEHVRDHYHHALCNLDLSELYLELNLSSEAAELAREASQEFRSQGLGYERAKALAFEAIAISQLGQSRHSVQVFRESRAIFVREKNHVWPSLIDLYQALVLFNAGSHTEARRLTESALRFFDSSPLLSKAVLCRLLLARIAQAGGDLERSHRECMFALDTLKDLQSPTLKHQTFLLMGQIQSALGNAQHAYSHLRE